MPRLWAETIETHRRQVHDAILDAAAELVAEHGPLSVTMASIAERAGIGRATLYKYFPDVESILVAWHARDFAHHLERLQTLSTAHDVTLDDVAGFVSALRRHHLRPRGTDVLGTLAQSLAESGGAVESTIHREIVGALTDLLTRLARRKELRGDHDPEFLAEWLFHCAHAPNHLDDEDVAQLMADSLAPRPGGRRRRRSH